MSEDYDCMPQNDQSCTLTTLTSIKEFYVSGHFGILVVK